MSVRSFKMEKFDWGDLDETDDEFFSRTNELFQRNPHVEKLINIWKFKIKNMRNWNRILNNPIEIEFSGYPKNNEVFFAVSFKKPINYNIVFDILFSPDIKRVFARYEHNFVEFDVTSEKILDFINTIINQHANSTYKECNTDMSRPMPSWVK